MTYFRKTRARAAAELEGLDPEAAAALAELRATNPQAYRKRLKGLVASAVVHPGHRVVWSPETQSGEGLVEPPAFDDPGAESPVSLAYKAARAAALEAKGAEKPVVEEVVEDAPVKKGRAKK